MNYSKVIVRKLILGIVSLSLTVVCLVSTTFAWFAKNQNAWIKDFDIDLTGVEGLQLSLDGENFSQDILSDTLKDYLVKDRTDNRKFDDLKFGCTSIIQENGLIKKENNQILFGYDEVYKDNTTNEYKHKTTDAKANEDKGFIKFDLYVRAKASYEDKLSYDLIMTDKTEIKSELVPVKLSNKLTTRKWDNEEYTNEYKEYSSGDTVNVDISNAVRLGIYNVDEDANGALTQYNDFNIYEMTNKYDLGSTAIEGSTDAIHDKTKNAMFTYYNNYFTKYPFDKAATNGEAFVTKDKTGLLDTIFGSFNYNPNKAEYNKVKLEVYIWLEGWDADYFVGVPENTSINVSLEFGLVQKSN